MPKREWVASNLFNFWSDGSRWVYRVPGECSESERIFKTPEGWYAVADHDYPADTPFATAREAALEVMRHVS